MAKRFRAILVGLLLGYVAYLPIMLIIEYAIYQKLDSEKAFYALYYALGAPFLLVPSNWMYVRKDELILNCVGCVALLSGPVVMLRRIRPRRSA